METVLVIVFVAFMAYVLAMDIGPEALSQARLSVSVLRQLPMSPPQRCALLRRFARWCLRRLAQSVAYAVGLAVLFALLPPIQRITAQVLLSAAWSWWKLFVVVGGLAILLGWLLGLLWYAALRIAAARHARAQPRREV